MSASQYLTNNMTAVGTYKLAEAEDQDTTHRTKEEASTNSRSSNSEASTPNTSAGDMSFFGALPRELRDAVYDYTFEHVVKQPSDTDDGVTFHFHAPVPNLRLVSRQFTAEYDERYKVLPPSSSLLTIVNNSRDNRPTWHGGCPQPATRCRELKAIRPLFDGRDEYTWPAKEATLREATLRKFLTHFHSTAALLKRMPLVQRVDVRFDFESLDHSGYPEELPFLFQSISFFRTWPVGKYEIRYQGLKHPHPDKLRELQVPNIDILDAPITLVTWTQALQTEQVDRRELEQHLRVEAAVLEAWKVKHGCSLWESKRLLREPE